MNYIILDGGDFIIFCQYTEDLNNNLKNDLIEKFYISSTNNTINTNNTDDT